MKELFKFQVEKYLTIFFDDKIDIHERIFRDFEMSQNESGGFNFNQVVMDPTKDVFIKFYSPNCGHCKAVAPIWEEFAIKIKESGNSNVIIADIDVSKNDFGFEIARYPLFFMYPATKEKIKLNYDNSAERTVEKFTEWLVANAKNKIIIKNDL